MGRVIHALWLLLLKNNLFFDNLRHTNKMLNDLFISRDVIGYLFNYVENKDIQDKNYLDRLHFYQSRSFMSYEQWWRLLDELEAIDDADSLGVEIGKIIKAEHVGVLGYLFKTSHTIGEALNCFMRFQRLIYAGSMAEIKQYQKDLTVIEWNPLEGYSAQTSDEILLVAMVNIIREMTSKQTLHLKEVNFTQTMSKGRIEACEQFFQCKVNAASEKLSITLPTAELLTQIPHSDLTLHEILGRQAEELLNAMPDSDMFLANLRDIIIRSLHKGRSDAKYISSLLNISERTLHRRLKSKGRVYREILQDIRKSLVINYLNDPKLSIAETALLLGYSEQSSFTRAFVQWYGQPPKEYKDTHLIN